MQEPDFGLKLNNTTRKNYFLKYIKNFVDLLMPRHLILNF
jgi:hypothetical protein